MLRGVATGGISGYIPPKSAQVNFLWGKNDIRTAIQQFYTPQKNFILRQNKFLATPLNVLRGRSDKVGTFFGRPTPKIWEGKKHPHRHDFWQFSTLMANISRRDWRVENRKNSWSTTTPPMLGEKSGWTWVNKQKSYRRTCWPFLSAVLCNLMQFHSPRGSRVQFSGTFAMWSCCERNFNYLNCLSSRTCGAGRCWLVCCMLICSLSLLGPDISKAVGMEYEMAYGESNGHVIDEATWPWKIKGVTPIRLWIITVRLR